MEIKERSLADFMSSIKVEDIMVTSANKKSNREDEKTKQLFPASKAPPILSEIQSNPPQNTASLLDFLNKVGKELIEEDTYCLPCTSSAAERSASSSEQGNDDGNDAESDDEDADAVEEDEDDGGEAVDSKMQGRRNNQDLKFDALLAPFADICSNLAIPCSKRCHFQKKCTNINMSVIFQERIKFFNPISEPAPSDREKASKILAFFENQMRRDANDNLCFNIAEHKLCLAGFARVIGITNSPDISKAPGQFRRLLNGHLNGTDKLQLLANQKIKLDAVEKFTEIRGFQEAFISDIAMFFSDSLPTVKSLNASKETKQLPYKHVKDLYDEMTYQCLTANPPVPKSIYGSLSTFQKVYDKLHSLGKVQLLGGKSGFETCAICNHCIAMKQSAVKKRDRQTIDIVRALQRLHMKQQQVERQHCENYIHLAKTEYNDLGEPTRWFIEADGMSMFKTQCPKLQKERTDPYPRMENRLIGCRIICGPIDEYIGITCSDIIPGGANIMIEVTKICLETLANRLAALDIPYELPDEGGLNYDNCGENKVRSFFELLHFIFLNHNNI